MPETTQRPVAPSVLCVNPQCERPLEAATRFCPYCATQQLQATGPATASPRPSPNDFNGVPPPDGTLVMRAGENIWDFEEHESAVAPGRERPLLILDEQTIHLARTDKHLTPEELLRRVQTLFREQKVPVDARLLQARWQNDPSEARARIVASLCPPHRYADLKAILGLDYLGQWASVHINLAVAPEPLPVPPLPPSASYWGLIAPVAAFVLSCIAVGNPSLVAHWSVGFGGSSLVTGGAILLGAVSVAWFFMALTQAAARSRERYEAWEAEQRRNEQEKLRERLSRTFKVDDARLFATAVRAVFQQVVDDIVQQSPRAEVVRVDGGRGGFFSEGGLTQAAPPARTSDAAQAAL